MRLQSLHGVVLLGLTACLVAAPGQDGLKTIDNPGGGQIIYGPVAGQSSLPGAMGAMLRNIQGRFGERPRIGRFFQARGTNSVATLFTVTPKGGKPLAGMVTVSMLANNQVGTSVMYDNAARFGTTAGAMFQKLNEALHPPANQSTAAPAAARGPQPLRRTPFRDGSGSIGLPAGWRLTGSGAGSAWAAGPNGEAVALAVILQFYDPSWLSYFGDGKSVPPAATIYRYQGDAVAAWLAAEQQNAQRNHTPVPTFVMTDSTRKPTAPGYDQSVVIHGELDFHDGKGPLVSKIQLNKRSAVSGSWGMDLTRLSIPKRLVNEESETVMAIAGSLNQNQAALDAMLQRDIDRIHQVGNAATARSQVEGAAHDRQNQAVYAMWDDQNRYSQAFHNYAAGQSPVRDNDTGVHRTFDNPDADLLVTLDPNRFQVVNTPEYQRFTDYRPFPAR